jgi:multiple sugar transport system ATP-binding protein
MTEIKFNNIRKNFFSLKRGRIEALRGITMTINAGRFFVLLGPSGCGKSTLLNIMAGIEKPSRGEILFNEQKVVSSDSGIFLSPRERDIAMVFQSYALYPHMTVFDNIAFPLKIAKVNKGEINQRVKDVGETLEIEGILEAKPAELSGGQRQRVALGRAIVRQPRVLLLDEPLSNLDALLRISMRSELKLIQRRIGVTTVYVTHDQTEALSLGDSMAVMKDGLVQQSGSPEEIYHDPANLFVAKFMGSPPMNIMNGELLSSATKKLPLTENINLEEIYLGVRPEHLQITEPEKGILKGKLNLISSHGSEKIVYISVEGQEVTAKLFTDIPFRENQYVGIDFDWQKTFLFARADGKRIK